MSDSEEYTREELKKLLTNIKAREEALAHAELELRVRERQLIAESRAIADGATSAIQEEKDRNAAIHLQMQQETERRENLEAERDALAERLSKVMASTPESNIRAPAFHSTPAQTSAQGSSEDTLQHFTDIRRAIEDLRLSCRARAEPLHANRVEPTGVPSTIIFKEALDGVPNFNGTNLIPFVRALKRAHTIIPPALQVDFIKILKTKFSDRAYLAVEGREFNSMDELINRLKHVFAPAETLNNLRGKLDALCKNRDVPLLDFINETLNLRDAILDRKRFDNNFELSQAEINELEKEVIEGFVDGLPPNFRLHLSSTEGKTLSEVFDDAIRVDKRIDRDRAKHFTRTNFNERNYPEKRFNNTSQLPANKIANNFGRKDPNFDSFSNKPKPQSGANNVKIEYNSATYHPDRICKYCKQQGH